MKSKRVELILIFLLSFLFSAYNALHSCQFFSTLGFDNQIITTWQFTSLVGLMPYKDVYFPYGILFYFKNTNVIFALLYLFLTSLLFSGIFLTLRKLWKKRIFAYTFFIAFIVFINFYTNFLVFSRYGIVVLVSLLFAYTFFKEAYLGRIKTLFLGMLVGLLFSLVNDQGIYSIVVFGIFLLANPLLHRGVGDLKKIGYYIYLIQDAAIFFLGICVGFFPFFLYLMSYGMLGQFSSSILHIADFGLYAKTPFIPYSMTQDNVFVYVSLFIAIFLLTYRIFTERKLVTTNLYLQLALIIVIILLEQKSFVRSISTQITFVAFLLLLVLVNTLDSFLEKRNVSVKKRLVSYIVILVIVFNFGLQSINSSQSPLGLSRDLSLYAANNECLQNNLSLTNNSAYEYIKGLIRKDAKDPKIFNYLGDPIFYALFMQRPPYYFTVFEASPLYAQKANIQYIEEEKVRYVIYNLDIAPIADGVPDYARGNLLFKYILNNFDYYQRKDNFIILKKKADGDIFNSQALQKDTDFRQHLLDVNLAAIPRSEGIYKLKALGGNKVLVSGSNEDVSNYLKRHSLSSSQLVLLLEPEAYLHETKEMTVELHTRDNLKTTVSFYRCTIGKTCIVAFSNIPLFYKERIIERIIVDKDFEGKIKLIKNGSDLLW